MNAARTRAEMQASASARQAKRAQLEHEAALQERAEQIAKLRAFRLAKEANVQKRAGTENNGAERGEEDATH